MNRSHQGNNDQKRTDHGRENIARKEAGPNFSGIGPKGYVRSDESIEEEVCEILARDKHLDPSDIVVAVEEGIVKLSGTVKERHERFEAERLAEHVAGVEDIENDISVRKKH